MMLVKFGYRTYEINNVDLTKIQAIWAHCVGSQNDFEDEVEKQGIEYFIEFDYNFDK